MARQTILVIEDEDDLREVVTYNLEREGFEVLATGSGIQGLHKARVRAPSLVLLDLMLPDIDGLEICRRLRADDLTARMPVIMVTAKGEESDVVLGLGLGADDYVAKPFSPRELVARVKAVLRRGPFRDEEGPSERILVGPLVVDKARHEAQVDGVPLQLTATEFRLLHFLAAHPGRVFTREQLLRRVLGEHVVLVDRNVDVHVRSIRQKLGEHRTLIETVRGVGYRFQDS